MGRVRRRVYVKAKKNELVRLKNERVCVEVGEKCVVCGKAFTKESVIARTKENRCVHEECLSEKKYDESRLLRRFDEPRRLCGKRMRVKRYAEAKPRGLSPHRTKECSLVASRKEDPLSIVV